MEIIKLTEYSKKTAEAVRRLLMELSRSGKDHGEVPREWFKQIIDSPWHDLILAVEGGEILGMATMSVNFEAVHSKIAYLEDFVVSSAARGKGVGGAIWDKLIEWSKEKGCTRLEFTCGEGREVAQSFYKTHGAEVYNTNFFRKEL